MYPWAFCIFGVMNFIQLKYLGQDNSKIKHEKSEQTVAKKVTIRVWDLRYDSTNMEIKKYFFSV